MKLGISFFNFSVQNSWGNRKIKPRVNPWGTRNLRYIVPYIKSLLAISISQKFGAKNCNLKLEDLKFQWAFHETEMLYTVRPSEIKYFEIAGALPLSWRSHGAESNDVSLFRIKGCLTDAVCRLRFRGSHRCAMASSAKTWKFWSQRPSVKHLLIWKRHTSLDSAQWDLHDKGCAPRFWNTWFQKGGHWCFINKKTWKQFFIIFIWRLTYRYKLLQVSKGYTLNNSEDIQK